MSNNEEGWALFARWHAMEIQYGLIFILFWVAIAQVFYNGVLPYPGNFILVILYSFLILLAILVVVPLLAIVVLTIFYVICEAVCQIEYALKRHFVKIESYKILHIPIDSTAAAIYEIRFSNGQVITPRIYYIKRCGKYQAYLPEEEKLDPVKELLFDTFYNKILKLPPIVNKSQ
jgi:hypothetical protein